MQIKILIYKGKRCNLVSDDGEVWRLFREFQQKLLHDTGAHYLDYWRKKGVIEGEEEKKD